MNFRNTTNITNAICGFNRAASKIRITCINYFLRSEMLIKLLISKTKTICHPMIQIFNIFSISSCKTIIKFNVTITIKCSHTENK